MMPRKRSRVDDGDVKRDSRSRKDEGSYEDEDSADETEEGLAVEEFHRLFAMALFHIGCSVASPAKIANEMVLDAKFPQLQSEHLKSHLQRFRKNQARHKETFLEDYDKFMEILQVIDEKNQMPGEFGMIDLSTVLGGKAAAMASYDAMQNKAHSTQKAVASASGPIPPLRSILDNTFVQTTSSHTGMSVTKLPAPKLSDAEKKTPVGVAFLHAIHLLKCLEQCLLQQRGSDLRPPPPQQQNQRLVQQQQQISDATAVSLETMAQALQRRRNRKQSELPPETPALPPPPPPPPPSPVKNKQTEPSNLDKLCHLVSEMSRREQSRQRKRSRKRRGSQFSSGDSSSSDESQPNPKYQRYLNRPRKGSLGESTVSTRSTSPYQGSINSSTRNAKSSTSGDWIFEGIPKPSDLRGGGFLLDMSSSSSSLSSSDTEEDESTLPAARRLAPTLSVRQRREAYRRKRSPSDVSLIGGQDNGELYVAGDGSIRSSRASSNGDPPGMPALPEEKQWPGPPVAAAAAASEPPSPSATAVMDYMEMSLLQDVGFSSLVLDSNWNESDFLTRSSRPSSPSQQQSLQQQLRKLQPRRKHHAAQSHSSTSNSYQSHAIMPSDLAIQAAPIPQPLSRPTLPEANAAAKMLAPTIPQAMLQNTLLSTATAALPPSLLPTSNEIQFATNQQQEDESPQGARRPSPQANPHPPPERRESLGLFHPVEAFPEGEDPGDGEAK